LMAALWRGLCAVQCGAVAGMRERASAVARMGGSLGDFISEGWLRDWGGSCTLLGCGELGSR
jgi:hypothetical protein